MKVEVRDRGSGIQDKTYAMKRYENNLLHDKNTGEQRTVL